MRRRTMARELALQLLYQTDIRNEKVGDIAEDFWQHEAKHSDDLNDVIKGFATTLAEGTFNNLEKIDAIISAYAKNWQLKRMAVVDRNIMRMAAYELLFMPDIPPKVEIGRAHV